MKTVVSLILAAVFAMAVPLSVNAISTNPEKKVIVHFAVQLEQDDFGLIERKEEIGAFEFGIFANENIKVNGDTAYQKNDLIIKEHCYSNGYVTFYDMYLPKGKYYIRQTSTSRYYELSDKKYTFDVGDEEEQDIDLTENGKFTAQLLKQKVSLTAIDESTGKSLSGAEIVIKSGNTVVYSGISNKSGAFSNLPILIPGEYTYSEVTAPNGYTLDTEIYKFYVDNKNISDKPLELIVFNDVLSETFIYGDVDGDGEITSGDSLEVLRHSVGLTNFNSTQKILADVDSDNTITSADALEILRYSVKIPTNGITGKQYIK